MRDIKLCTIGCGFFSRKAHGASYLRYKDEVGGLTLAGCCDLNLVCAKEYRQKFGFAKAYDNYYEMIEKERPDAICLILPEKIGASLAVDIAKYGIPILMEKPPGYTCKETKNIIDASRDTSISVAFNRRAMPLMRNFHDKICEDIEQRRVYHLHLSFLRVGRKDEDFTTTAIHGIDYVRYLLQSDYRNLDFQYTDNLEGGSVQNFFISGTMVNGVNVQMQFCPQTGIMAETINVCTQNKAYSLNIPGPQELSSLSTWMSGESSPSIIWEEEGDDALTFEIMRGYYQENADFFNSIKNGYEPTMPVSAALQSVEIMCCLRERRDEYKMEKPNV